MTDQIRGKATNLLDSDGVFVTAGYLQAEGISFERALQFFTASGYSLTDEATEKIKDFFAH